MLETHGRKKFIIQHYRETKISQIIVFWSNGEIKMQRNLKTVQKNRIIKLSRKFLALK